MNNEIEAWKLFNSLFKNGEEVFIITDDDELFFGRMSTDNNGLWLKRIGKKSKYYFWDDIHFMSHDGFPVRKLLGADGSKSIEKEPAVIIEGYREPSLVRENIRSDWVFGDPFHVENVSSMYVKTFYNGDVEEDEELILMESKDGAKGVLYGFDSIYYAQ